MTDDKEIDDLIAKLQEAENARIERNMKAFMFGLKGGLELKEKEKEAHDET